MEAKEKEFNTSQATAYVPQLYKSFTGNKNCFKIIQWNMLLGTKQMAELSTEKDSKEAAV